MKNSPQSQVFGFQGSTALITGASRGIGAATAKTLARYGANVVLLARSDSRVEELARGIRDSGGQALAHVGDVSVYEDMVRVVEAAREAFGTLDILVNNAGVIDPIEPIVSADAAAWAQTLDINVKGVFYGTRAALPGMLERGQGTIVNMSSGAANSAL